jgi:hypothetical protein
MPTTLTRTVSFFALHRLYRPEWSPQQNQQAFGALSQEPPHGHQYSCAVTVASGPQAPADLLVDLAELDRILEAEHFFRRIAPRLPGGATLERVGVSEDPTLYADCTGLA